MGNCCIQEVEKVDKEYHMGNDKVSIIFNGGAMVTLRTFKTMKELNHFAVTLGFTYNLMVSTMSDRCGRINTYAISHFINDPPNYFWSLAEIPPGAQKVVLTENGQDVTCYFINDGSVINIFRPNCNAKEVYKLYFK